jgi:hypothetical protein
MLAVVEPDTSVCASARASCELDSIGATEAADESIKATVRYSRDWASKPVSAVELLLSSRVGPARDTLGGTAGSQQAEYINVCDDLPTASHQESVRRT